MSGGHFDYTNDNLCHDIYGWSIYPDYGNRGFEQSNLARRLDPFDDILISELIFDVFCLIHSYDWYQSGDTGEDTYRKDVQRFKDKWLKQIPDDRVKTIIDDELNLVRGRLYNTFLSNGGSTDVCTT